MDKPKEFWIRKSHKFEGEDDLYHGIISDSKIDSSIKTPIHVIEYSAYEKLAADKYSNDKDYLELAAKYNTLEKKFDEAVEALRDAVTENDWVERETKEYFCDDEETGEPIYINRKTRVQIIGTKLEKAREFLGSLDKDKK